MAKKKSYHTIDELLEQQRQNAFSNFSVGDNKEYHTIDEIKKAATEQGLLTERAPATQPSAQTTSGRRNLMIRNNQIKNDSRQWKQNQVDGSNPFDLRNQVYKTQNETIPRIAQQAASDYVKNRMGYNYISQYGDDTRYSDVSNDISRVQQLKGGAARRGKDTEVYDRALEMLKGYSQRYRLDNTDTSPEAVKDREDLYNDNKREISRLNSQLEAEKGGSLNQALRQWLDSYDDNGIITDEDNQYYIDEIKKNTGYDITQYVGGLDSQKRSEKAEQLRTTLGEDTSVNDRKRIEAQLDSLNTQNRNYERYQKPIDDYQDVRNDPNFSETSFADIANSDRRDKLSLYSNSHNEEFNSNYDDPVTLSNIVAEGDVNGWGTLTNSEKDIYYHLLDTQGEEAAYKYLDDMKLVLQKRETGYAEEQAKDVASARPLGIPIGGLASVPGKMIGGALAFADDALHTITGEEINPYDPAHRLANETAAVMESDVDYINDKTNNWNIGGFTLGDAYQALASVEEMGLGIGMGTAAYSALMSMDAAQSKAKELYDSGASNEVIAAESLASGAFEYVFEKVSLDTIANKIISGMLTKESAARYITAALMSAGVEGSEEVATEAANYVADIIIRKEQSERQTLIKDYLAQGYSQEEAEKRATDAFIEDLYKSFMGGALAGAIGGGYFGGAYNSVKSNIQERSERNQYIRNVGEDVTGAGNAQALLDRAAQIDDPAVKAQAQKTQQALDKANQKSTKSTNNRLSRETGKLYAAMQDSTAQGIQNAEANEIKSAIKSAYAAQTGETDSSVISKVADAIYKSEYTNERLTRSERNLAETAAAQSAIDSVKNNPDLIESATQKAQERGFRDYVETAKLTQKQEQETKTDDDVDIDEFNYHEDDGKVYTSDGKKQVDIASVASIGDNDITFNLNDGQTESAKSLDMPTNQAVLAQSILDVQKKIGVPLTADIANTLYQGYEQSDSPSVSAYMQDAQTVLFNGYANNTAPDSSIKLPQGLRNQLYSMGRQLAASHTQAQQQSVNARVKGNKSRKGTVTFQDGINRNRLDPRRRAGVDAVEHLAQSLGFDVVFYRSTKDGKGRFSSEYVRKNKFVADGQQAPSGFWRGGKMYLDINAGMNGEGLILFTASHELVHMIREGSPEDFKALSDFLVNNYAEQGVDINDLVRKEMARSTNLTRDQALEEVIAESCETFLRDTTLNDKAQELYKQNPTLWSRIREALKRIVDAVKQWYAVARPQSEEARITNRAGVETLEQAYNLWTKGIIKSAENLRNMENNRTDTKYQGRTETQDTEYLDAVERGDMETAQRMVDEAAERAFANSKIRDKDGKLLKMYHGTSADFTVFDVVKYGGKTGTAEGLGINLIDRKEGASGYGERVIESYVNITKPAKTWEKTLSKNDLVKLIRKSAETEAQRMVKEDDYNSVNEALKDTWISNYVNTYEYSNIEDAYKEVADTVLRYNTNDRDIVWEVVNGSGASYSNENWIKFYSEILKPTIGVDGFWTTWAAKDGKRANVVIAFDSSQVKSADPVTYDDNGDVISLSERFNENNKDIRFSLRDTIEQTDRLIAWHNMSVDGLMGALELGGLAMPSWAIKTANNPHSSYGEVSVIAPRELVDPKTNRNSMVFGGDAWTPVFPEVNYKVTYESAEKLKKEIVDLVGEKIYKQIGGASLDPDNISEQFKRNGGALPNYYRDNLLLRYAYLKSIGKDIEVPTKDEELYGTEFSNDAVKRFSYNLIGGKSAANRLLNMPASELMEQHDIKQAIADLRAEEYREKLGEGDKLYLMLEKDGLFDADHVSFREVEGMLRAARKYLDRGVKQMVDKKALSETVEKEINSTDYEKWIKNKLEKTIIRKGIRNNKDIFTPSGKRRSFESLNYEYTLANVVKAMKSQPKQGRAQFLSGPGSVKGAALKNYADIEQVRADRGRLVADEESGKDAYEAYNKNLEDILDRMSINTDRFDTADAVIEILQHAKTENGIYNYMQRELKGWYNVSHELAHDIYELIGQINKLPMEYFEGKTYDAVTFNQVAGVVVPDSIDSDLKNQLINAGANVIEYKAGDNEDRLIKVNSIEKAKFQSRENNSYYGFTDDAFDIDFGEDDSVKNLIAREFVTHHEDIGEVLRNIADIDLSPSKVQSIVNRVIRNELGYLDEEARRTLSIELQLALERVSNTDAQDVSNEMINAVRKAVEGARITDERTQASYQELRNVFKGKKYFLTDEQINQLKEHDMTFDDFRKAMFGKVTIVKRENAKRSINGGYADAQQLSLEGLHDVLDNPEEVLGIRRYEWDNKNYDAPYIIKKAFDNLREQQSQLVTDMYSDEAIDDMAIAIAAKITGDIVEAKYNSRKNPYVSKLVKDLQAKRTEAVNRQKERNKQKLAELKTKERERAEKREQDLKKKYQEQRDRNREGRKRTELRGKIRKLTDSLQRRLTVPKGKQYVPRELISQTVDVLNAVNLDSGRSTRLSEKLAALRNEYDKLKEREESYAMHDDFISNRLLDLSDSVGNTPIMNMTLSQLKQVYDVIRSMDYVIRESVKMTDTNFKKETHQIGRDWITEIKAVPKEHVGILSGYVQTMLSAERFFNRIAGFKKNSTSSQLFDMLNKGQLAQTQYEMEFTQIFADLIQDKQLKSLYDTKNLVDIGLEDEDGNKVPITRGMMLSLYMHLLNEDNTRHVMGGGLTVPNMKDYYKGDVKKAFGNGMKSVRVGALDYSQYAEGIKSVIERQLTEYEIKWIEAAQEFFDVASRKALNETTMKLYGFRRANVNNYFPIHTDSNYRAPSFESITRDMSLENSGFMKERVKASNPIYLEDIVDVINDQISKVAKYCGMTLPIRNFQKVYGTTTHDFESSVQRELNRKFSASKKNAGATKYIDNLLTDLTSGRSTDDGFIARMLGRARGNLAQATLTLNPRVAIAQAASYPTAAAVIGWEPLFKALRKGGKNNTVFSRADREEIAEISPLLWKRTQGYSNVEIGDIKELRKQRHQVEGKLKKAMGWIEFFDGMTVGRLFYACQYYVDEQNPELKRGTAEYNAKVADVYNKVIERTQPNYTTLQRPDILRNPNALIKSLSMFMTQRLQNFNILYDAAGTYNRYLKDYKKGLNGVTAEDVKGARKTLVRSVTSQLVAAGTIVGMKLFADVLLHSMNAYRDDDDELTAESVSLKLLDNFADTLFGSVLFGSDLYSLVKSAISGSRYYGISLSGVDSLVDAVTNIVNLRKGITLDSANKAATSVCQLFGIPLNNAEKIGKAIYYWASDISGGEAFESGVNRTNKQNIHRYETRLNSGEADKAKELLTAMLDDKMSQGKTEKEAKSWLRGRFTATYKQRYIDAVNSNDTEEVKNIREILLSTGLYGSLSEQDKTLKKWLE